MGAGLRSIATVMCCFALVLGALSVCTDARAKAPVSKQSKPVRAKGARSTAELAKPMDPTLARPILGIGAGLFSEDTDQTSELNQAGIRDEKNEEEGLVADSLYNIQLWALFPAFSERLMLGGGVAWYNTYAVKDPENDNEDDVFEVGQMFAVAPQAEFLVPRIISKLNVLIGVRGGMLLAFAGGELQDELERLDRAGFSVAEGLPRFGWFVGPHFGMNWPFTDRLRARADIGVQFTTLSLWSGTAEAAGITSKTSSSLDSTRIMVVVGPEFAL